VREKGGHVVAAREEQVEAFAARLAVSKKNDARRAHGFSSRAGTGGGTGGVCVVVGIGGGGGAGGIVVIVAGGGGKPSARLMW
jgi:uncharacterized membrane protein